MEASDWSKVVCTLILLPQQPYEIIQDILTAFINQQTTWWMYIFAVALSL